MVYKFKRGNVMEKTAEELKKQKRYQVLAIVLFLLVDLEMIGIIIYSWHTAGLCFYSIFITILFGYTAILITLILLACCFYDTKLLDKALFIARPLEGVVNKLNSQEDKYFKDIGICNGLDQIVYYLACTFVIFACIGKSIASKIDSICSVAGEYTGIDSVVLSIILLIVFMLLAGNISARGVNAVFVKISEKQLKDSTEDTIQEIKNQRKETGQCRSDCDRAIVNKRIQTDRQIKLMAKYDKVFAEILHKKMMMIMLFIFTATVILFPNLLVLNNDDQAKAVNAVTLVTLLITVIQNISIWNSKLQVEKDKYTITADGDKTDTKDEEAS